MIISETPSKARLWIDLWSYTQQSKTLLVTTRQYHFVVFLIKLVTLNQVSCTIAVAKLWAFVLIVVAEKFSFLGLPITCPFPDVHFPVWTFIEHLCMIFELTKRVSA